MHTCVGQLQCGIARVDSVVGMGDVLFAAGSCPRDPPLCRCNRRSLPFVPLAQRSQWSRPDRLREWRGGGRENSGDERENSRAVASAWNRARTEPRQHSLVTQQPSPSLARRAHCTVVAAQPTVVLTSAATCGCACK